jgi:hypothetical protein
VIAGPRAHRAIEMVLAGALGVLARAGFRRDLLAEGMHAGEMGVGGLRGGGGRGPR